MPVNPTPSFTVKITPGKAKVTVKPGPVTITNHYGDIWANITGKPTTFPPSAHRHPASEIDGLSIIVGPKGDKGDTGERGLQGVAGVDGVIGVNGTPGAKGDKGDTGSQGLPGERGLQGVQGDIGPQGIQGNQGVQGEKGDTGSTGSQGLQGVPGLKGDTGEKGDKGDIGERGLQGIQGIQGVKGDKGDTGNDGVSITGPQGIQGIQGIQGDTGPAGATGLQGLQGVKGDTGERGLQGLQGIQGETGLQGLKGDKGDTGLTGLKGDKGDTGERGLQGDQGFQGERGLQGLPGNNGTDGLKGDKGDTGERGLQGDQGIQGVPGVAGAVGAKGDKGDTGERGLQGEQGLQGERGLQGLQGNNGTAGLKGDKGDTGERGLQGEPGIQGIAGNNGTTGLKGDKGDTGERGLQGEQGLQGIQGVKGDTGATGPQGPAGNSTGGGTADYVAWANVTGKPTTFAPTAHGHVISAITGLQTALDAKISTTTADGKYSLLTHQHQWTEILSKPSTFSPSNHTHNTTDITGISNYMLTSTATSSFKPISYAPQWTDILSKPSVFTPDTHTHDWSVIANKPTSFTPPIATSSVLGGVRVLSTSRITIDSSGYINANIPSDAIGMATANGLYVLSNASAGGTLVSRSSTSWNQAYSHAVNAYGASSTIVTSITGTPAYTTLFQSKDRLELTGVTAWSDNSVLTLGKALSTFALVGSGSGGGNTTVTWTTLSGKPSTFTPPIATTDILGGVMVGAGLTVDSCGTLSATPNWANITGKPSTFVPPVANLTVLGGIKPGYGVTVASDGTLDVTVSGNGGTATTIAWANITGKPTTFAPTIANSTTVGGIRPGIGLTVSANGTMDCTVTGNGGSTATWDTLAGRPDTFNPPVASASLLGGVKPIGNITVDYSGQIDVMVPETVNWSTLTGKPSTFAPPIATGSVLGGVKVGTGLSVASDGTLNATGSTASVLTSASGNALAILDRTGSSLLYTHTFSDSSGAVSMIDDGTRRTQMTLGPRTLTASGITTWSDNSLLTRAYADARYSSATSVDWVNVANKPVATANQVLTYNGSLWIAANHTNCLTTTNGNISATVTTDGLTLTKVMANTSEIVVPAIKVNEDLYPADGKRNVNLTWNHGLGNHATSLTLGDTYARIKAATGLNAGPDPGDTACYPNGFALSVHDYSHPYDITTKYWADLKYAPSTVTNYSLPTASSSVLGGVKVGDNLTIANGVLSAQGGVSGFNNRTGNVSLTSSDVTSALTYTPLTTTTPYSNLSFTGTSTVSPFLLKIQNANGSKYTTMGSTTAGTVDLSWVINNTRANGQVDTYYPFMRLYTDPVYPDINEGKLLLQYNYTANASTGPYYNTSIQIGKTKAEFFAQTYTWTDNSLITRVYADSRYLTSANMSAYLTTANASATYLPSANFTYANLTGTPSTFAPSAHTHAISEVTGLQTALDAKLPSANFTYANLTGTPNLTLYLTTANASTTYQPLGNYATTSCLTFANITGKPTTLSGYGITDGYSTSNPSGYITAGANTFTGTQNLQDNEMIRAKLRDYSETVSSPTISAGTLTLNLETSNIFTVSLNAAITTLTISNPPASGSGGSFTLIFTADGTSRAVTWPAAIKWAGGTAPTLTSTSGKVDSFAFFTSDGGTTWQGYIGGQNF